MILSHSIVVGPMLSHIRALELERGWKKWEDLRNERGAKERRSYVFLSGIEGTLYCKKTGLTVLDWTRRKVCNRYGTIYGNQTHIESI